MVRPSSFPSNAKIAVIGGRNFTDKFFLFGVLNHYYNRYGVDWVFSGGADGADTYAREWAKYKQVRGFTEFYAQWNAYGKSAGYMRNSMIVEASQTVIAFPCQESKGTLHSIDLANRNNMPYLVCLSKHHFGLQEHTILKSPGKDELSPWLEVN